MATITHETVASYYEPIVQFRSVIVLAVPLHDACGVKCVRDFGATIVASASVESDTTTFPSEWRI